MSDGDRVIAEPWEVRVVQDTGPSEFYVMAGKHLVASNVGTREEAELIAAAPDLLEALDALWGANERQESYLPAREKARAALARAKRL
jgi:hypothetical protein